MRPRKALIEGADAAGLFHIRARHIAPLHGRGCGGRRHVALLPAEGAAPHTAGRKRHKAQACALRTASAAHTRPFPSAAIGLALEGRHTALIARTSAARCESSQFTWNLLFCLLTSQRNYGIIYLVPAS